MINCVTGPCENNVITMYKGRFNLQKKWQKLKMLSQYNIHVSSTCMHRDKKYRTSANNAEKNNFF